MFSKKFKFILSISYLLTVFVLLSLFNSCNKADSKFVRKNIHSEEAQADVQALNKALQIMREKDCTDPTSWYYQSGIHWVPDTVYTQNFCSSYQNISQLKESWDNCTHSKGSEIHFLVWHRLYIYHFEKIVRKLSGKKDFALPYWDYTNTQNTKVNRTLHPLFLDKSSSLFEACRYDSLNMGYPISGEVERALDITQLFKLTTYPNFNHAMDIAPHGAIHDYVGLGNDTTNTLKFNNPITGTVTPFGLMGWVPTAAFDPIFWTHHSNIDRLWQQWTNSENGQPVTLEDLESFPWSYVFFDENGDKVTYTNEEIMKIIYNLDYEYDDTKTLGKETKIKPLQVIKPITSTHKHKLNSQLTELIVGKTESDLKGKSVKVTISFTTRPRGIYEVYLNKSDVLHPSQDSFLGFMSFFGSDHKTPNSICNKGCCGEITNDGRYKLEFTYEITKTLSQKDLNVSIYKPNGLIHDDLVIESITIY